MRGVLCPLALLTGLFVAAATLASRLRAGANLSVRFCGFLLCATWLSMAGFHLLAATGGFRLGYGLLLVGSEAAAAVLWIRADPARTARPKTPDEVPLVRLWHVQPGRLGLCYPRQTRPSLEKCITFGTSVSFGLSSSEP
jgi:hypothetical protein